MSTIASPREPAGPFPRRANSSIITPTSSSRPSLDVPASASSSPNLNVSSAMPAGTSSQSKRATRAALREYYNLRNNNNKSSTPIVEVTDDGDPSAASSSSFSFSLATSDPASSELDSPDFDAGAYVSRLLETSTLADLLRAYTRVLSEMRALDAEKKALVYDNYSKLIAATETIRRMRATQHPDVLAGGALEGVVEGIYTQAVGLREGLRESISSGGGDGEQAPDNDDDDDGEEGRRRRRRRRERTRRLAKEVLLVPGRLRRLVEEGREEEARSEWELPRRLLERWRELGVGGEDVGALIEEGDAVLKGVDAKGGDAEKSEVASTTT
ncbi:Vps51/Vps67-domain-containing protein [Chaetomium strumarium]|uniref:Vacuolar protein sorting-associated protein 51 homolog n=1 Tax=Chaetomium strumarium TaxID=1170767 RepID=A0AAJ0GTX4_9PEZI|nr:Vps51/Vps67-domain-containing protein [Chaetomium strumarium]